jgi:anti-sigma-K factor RskA
MNQAIKSRYGRRIPQYSSYTRTSKNSGYSNGTSVLAKKIMIQAAVCILVVFLCILFQNSAGEVPQRIVSEIRTRVVERSIKLEDIAQSFTDTYEECVQYIQGNN